MKLIKMSLLSTLGLMIGFTVSIAYAQDACCEQQKLTSPEAESQGLFGGSVAIDGNVAVVGAFNEGNNNEGAAHVYQFDGDTFVLVATLTSSDRTAYDQFGGVSISGDTIMIGAPQDDEGASDSGSVYVFEKLEGVWTETHKILHPEPGAVDVFGAEVSLSGDTVVIAARNDDDNGSNSGSAYVFRRDDNGTPSDPSDDDWPKECKLTAPDALAGDFFGRGVANDDDTIVVGATQHNWGGNGAAYVFQRYEDSYPCQVDSDCGACDPTICTDNICEGVVWIKVAKLTACDGAPGDRFGAAVAINGDTVVVGAYFNDEKASNAGSAYVFVRSCTGWEDMTETAQLNASNAAANEGFGLSVSINFEDTIVVGDNAYHNQTSIPGFAYVFEEPAGGWESMIEECTTEESVTETCKLEASDGESGDQFGNSVSISGSTVLVGAPFDDHSGHTDAGSTYVFVVGGDDCNGNGNPDWCDIAEGTSEDCNENRIPDECEPDADSDGFIDDCDECPNSDLSTTVVIDDCDTEVINQLFEDRCTMADRIGQCADAAVNNAVFVCCVAHMTNEWKQEGVISGAEKGPIQSCAAQADIP